MSFHNNFLGPNALENDKELFAALLNIPIPPSLKLKPEKYSFLSLSRIFKKQTATPSDSLRKLNQLVVRIHAEMKDDLDSCVSQLEMIQSRLENIFFYFQLELHHVEPLLELYSQVLESMWNNGERITAQHWKYLTVCELSTEGFDRAATTIKRHPFDIRYDPIPLHVGEKVIPFEEGAGHPMHSFSTLRQTDLPTDKLECQLTATYGWIDPTPLTLITAPLKRNMAHGGRKNSTSSTHSANFPMLTTPNHSYGRRSSISANLVNDNVKINPQNLPVGAFATAVLGSASSIAVLPRCDVFADTSEISLDIPYNLSVIAATSETISSIDSSINALKMIDSVNSSQSGISASSNNSILSSYQSPNLSSISIGNSGNTRLASGQQSPSWMVSPDVSKHPSPAVSQVFPSPYIKNDGKILTNDPNNGKFATNLLTKLDGYVVLVFPGSVVDGSGYGHRARLASNIVLSVVNELSVQILDRFEKAKEASETVPSTFIQQWLQNVCIVSHRRIKEIAEAGATTLTIYTVSKIAASSNYLCCYVVAGDTEGYYYSEATDMWKPLFKDPSLNEAIRLDTSIVPGGFGGYHGDDRRIHGLYMWNDSDWGEKDISNEPRSAKCSNLHFGQVLLGRNDKILFATDGLGDVIDPARIFLKPTCANECAKLLKCDWMPIAPINPSCMTSWSLYSKYIPQSGITCNRLKNAVMNKILQEEKESSQINPNEVVSRCIDFAFFATLELRQIEERFAQSEKSEKESALDKALANYWQNRVINRGSTRVITYRHYMAPFAKVDHLGIVSLAASIVDD